MLSPIALPWARLTTRQVLEAFNGETRNEVCTTAQLGQILLRLLPEFVSTIEEGLKVAEVLLPCFDRDGSGDLSFGEVFGGMATLCSDTTEERY